MLLTLPFQLIPVLLDGHVPLPLQVDHLVVVNEPGLDHILAVRHHALGRHPGRTHKLLGLGFGPVAPHHEGRVVHCMEDSRSAAEWEIYEPQHLSVCRRNFHPQK